jgi:uroporphyrinogen-III synthase
MMAPDQPSRALLIGTRILVGRARHQASALSEALRALGADVIEIPFIEIRPPRSFKRLDAALQDLGNYDWLILTSANGVDALAGRMRALRIATEDLNQVNIAAIGPATRDAIEKLGRKVAIVPDRYVAESVVEKLRGNAEGKRVLLARAKIARDVIPRELRKLGARVDVVEAYETAVPASSGKQLRSLMRDPNRRPHVITFTSSSSVRNFVHLLRRQAPERSQKSFDASLPKTKLHEIQVASIGPVTSATLRELGLPVHVEAAEYTIPGLINAILAARTVPQNYSH